MILITGAAGKTGLAVMMSLLKHKQTVRAFVRSVEQKQKVDSMGTAEVVIGDMTRAGDISQAMRGVQKMLHICPNVHTAELTIGTEMIAAAKQADVEHFVFHSVMHPQIEAMPHHWQKMRVEEMLIESGLPYTIVQPASYMQNLQLNAILAEGILRVPYNPQALHSMVNLMDVAEVYIRVLVEPGHQYATYELAGPQALDHFQIAEEISQAFHQSVEVVQESIADWRRRAQTSGLSSYAIETLVKMFAHYNQHGFIGNPTVLQHLLPAPAVTFSAWLNETVQE